MPASALEAIKAEAHGEQVLWAARPDPGIAFRQGFAIWGMAIPWCAVSFTVFGGLVAVVFSGKPPLSQVSSAQLLMMVAALIFTGAFVVGGLAMLSAPFLARSCARRTVYAITPKRVLTIVIGSRGAIKVVSFAPQSAVKLDRSERLDGSGTLRIVLGYTKGSDGDAVEKSEEWIGIPDVRTPERLLESLRSAGSR